MVEMCTDINMKLKAGKRLRNIADWEKSIREARVRVGQQYHRRRRRRRRGKRGRRGGRRRRPIHTDLYPRRLESQLLLLV